MYARGTLVGLTSATQREHVVRATLEAIAFQTADVLAAMREGKDEVFVDLDTATRAQGAVQRMIEIGKPGGGE